MFRSLIHITVSLLLLTSITGFSISKHYCGDQFVSVRLNQEAKSCCDMSGGCCHTETVFFQLDEDYIINSDNHNYFASALDLLFSFIIRDYNQSDALKTNNRIGESPPPPKIQTRLSSLQTFLC